VYTVALKKLVFAAFACRPLHTQAIKKPA
jgi:hypothetical protein